MQLERVTGYSSTEPRTLVNIPSELGDDKVAEQVQRFLDQSLYKGIKRIVIMKRPAPAEAEIVAENIFAKYFEQLKKENKIEFDARIERIVVKDCNVILKMAKEIIDSTKSFACLNIAEVLFSKNPHNHQVVSNMILNNMSDWKIVCYYGVNEKNQLLSNYNKETKQFTYFSVPQEYQKTSK